MNNDGKLVTQFQRLLAYMESLDLEKLSDTDNYLRTPRALQARADRLEQLWEHLQHYFDDDLQWKDTVMRRVQQVRQRVDRVSSFGTEDSPSSGLLDRLFPKTVEASARDVDDSDQLFLQDSDSASSSEEDEASARPLGNSNWTTPQGVASLQKAQREQIEEAIGRMASQMKAETERIHTSLQGQTRELDTLEDVAVDNVDKVSQVATNVQDHVSANWRRSLGTWTLIFVMMGAFLFSLVTIRMVPKRQSRVCLFFCNNQQQEDTDRFCRLLSNGRRECIYGKRPVEKTEQPSEKVIEGDLDDDEEIWRYAESLVKKAASQEPKVIEAQKAVPPVERTPPRQASIDAFDMYEPDHKADGAQQEQISVPMHNGKPFGPRDVVRAAVDGDWQSLRAYVTQRPEWGRRKDENGWSPLHLAARHGDFRSVEVLLNVAGADADDETNSGQDAMGIAMHYHDTRHPVVRFLDHWDNERGRGGEL